MDLKQLKQGFHVAKNEDIPTIGRLLSHNENSVYILNATPGSKPVLLATLIRKVVKTEILHGYNVLHGLETGTGELRSLRITEDGVVESHSKKHEGWRAIPLKIVHIYIPW